MPAKLKTHDEYLASVSDDKRAALQVLRETIRDIVPDAEECITYQMPAFKQNGKAFAGYAAFKNHCSYFPMNGGTTETLKEELAAYKTSKGAVQFDPARPLPRELVRKLIETRLAEER